MQISSSTAGLYPVLVPTARKPVVAPNTSTAVSATAAATEQVTGQRGGDTKRELFPALDAPARQDAEGLNAGGLTRQFNRLSVQGVVENVVESTLEISAQGSLQRSGSVFNPAQRAVAVYVDVATQEHRAELVELLGIDVFA